MKFLWYVLAFGCALIMNFSFDQVMISIRVAFPILNGISKTPGGYACFNIGACKSRFIKTVITNLLFSSAITWAICRFGNETLSGSYLFFSGALIIWAFFKCGMNDDNIGEFLNILQKYIKPEKEADSFTVLEEGISKAPSVFPLILVILIVAIGATVFSGISDNKIEKATMEAVHILTDTLSEKTNKANKEKTISVQEAADIIQHAFDEAAAEGVYCKVTASESKTGKSITCILWYDGLDYLIERAKSGDKECIAYYREIVDATIESCKEYDNLKSYIDNTPIYIKIVSERNRNITYLKVRNGTVAYDVLA